MTMDIKALREAAGMSQAKLAERMDVTGPAIAQWESGRAKPNEARQAQLRRIFEPGRWVPIEPEEPEEVAEEIPAPARRLATYPSLPTLPAERRWAVRVRNRALQGYPALTADEHARLDADWKTVHDNDARTPKASK
jgi:transcriptional regulator with XRE-family HTH domain